MGVDMSGYTAVITQQMRDPSVYIRKVYYLKYIPDMNCLVVAIGCLQDSNRCLEAQHDVDNVSDRNAFVGYCN